MKELKERLMDAVCSGVERDWEREKVVRMRVVKSPLFLDGVELFLVDMLRGVASLGASGGGFSMSTMERM
jgi:hypothetical protein